MVGTHGRGSIGDTDALIYAKGKEEPGPPKMAKLIDDEQIGNLKGAINNDLEVACILAEQAEDLAAEAVTLPVDLDKLERAGNMALVSARIIHNLVPCHWVPLRGFEKFTPQELNLEELIEEYSESMLELESKGEEVISELNFEGQGELSTQYEELKSELSSKYEDLLSGLESKYQEMAAELGESPELEAKYGELRAKLEAKYQQLLSKLRSKYEELKSSPSKSKGPWWSWW